MTVRELKRAAAREHPDAGVYVELPDGTRLRVGGWFSSDDMNPVLVLTLDGESS